MSACQWIHWGPDSIWLLTHTGPATTRHTHTQTSALNSPLSFRHRLPWWHQSACWHGDPSITKSGHLGSPEHPTGRVLRVFNAYVCVCEDAYLARFQTLWRCATTTLALPGPPVFFLYFFCYSVHLFTAFNRCLISERRLQTVCTKYA